MRNRNIQFVFALLIFVIMLVASCSYSIGRQGSTRTATTYVLTSVESPSYEICFSPEGDCEARILYWIQRANLSIHVMVYTLTLDRVGDALVNAYKRGIEVKVILDRYNSEEGSEYDKLVQAGVSVRVHQGPGLMHNKVAVIDSSIVITGSYNWTGSAEKENHENLLVIRSIQVSDAYEKEFDRIWNSTK